jgi:energy-coupling factor transporter ATP-binding protein EcfA2
MMQQTNGMRLEKLELSNFAQFNERQEIEFSDDSKITIIQGRNDSGKTTLFKAMRAGLGLEKQDEEYGQPQLKCNFDPAVINNENEFLFFQDGESLSYINDMNFSEFDSSVNMHVFEKNVQELFLKCANGPDHITVVYNLGKFYISRPDGTPAGFAAEDKYRLSMCILISLRKILFPDSFLVIDSPFGRMSVDKIPLIYNILLENIPQLVLLVTDVEYSADSENAPSLKNILKMTKTAVSEYRLITKENQTKIEKRL